MVWKHCSILSTDKMVLRWLILPEESGVLCTWFEDLLLYLEFWENGVRFQEICLSICEKCWDTFHTRSIVEASCYPAPSPSSPDSKKLKQAAETLQQHKMSAILKSHKNKCEQSYSVNWSAVYNCQLFIDVKLSPLSWKQKPAALKICTQDDELSGCFNTCQTPLTYCSI